MIEREVTGVNQYKRISVCTQTSLGSNILYSDFILLYSHCITVFILISKYITMIGISKDFRSLQSIEKGQGQVLLFKENRCIYRSQHNGSPYKKPVIKTPLVATNE